MNILVYKKEKKGLKCPNCGENIDINKDIIKYNNNIKDILCGLKIQIENIINCKNYEIKNIILIKKYYYYNG